MSRHELDATSLVTGLAFLVGGTTLLLARTTDVHASWALVATLLALGLAAVVAGATSIARGPADAGGHDPAVTPPAAGAADPEV